MVGRLARRRAIVHYRSREQSFPRAPAGARVALNAKETCMTWQTPTATDLRFGFEITMYVSAR